MIFNKEDIKSLLIQIIALLMGTGILVVIGYLFSKGVKSFGNFVNWLCQPIPIAAWVLLLSLAIILYLLINVVNGYLKSQKVPSKMQFSIKEVPQKLETPKRLERIEEDILVFLSKNERHGVVIDMIKNDFPQIQESKLIFYVDGLFYSQYIKKGYANRFYLVHKGREYLIKNKIIS